MPRYDLVLHETAEREYRDLEPEQQGKLKSILEDVATTEVISQHSKVKHLEGQPGMFRVRTGQLRAIVTLEKPELRILKVGTRRKMYQDIDATLQERTA